MMFGNVTWELEDTRKTDGDVPVWVCVKKLDKAWQRDSDLYIGAGGGQGSIGNRYDRVGVWIQTHNKLFMPTLSFDELGNLGFTDGRHRFAWLRDHKTAAIQIAVPQDQVAKFARLFRTELRESVWLDFCK